jgi:hypothetical protein
MNALKRRILPVLALVLVVAAGCAQIGIGVTNVADIRKSPASFEGKEVVLKGTVREVTKVPLVELKSYVLADATGEMTVTTKGTPPAKGDKVIVRGDVASAAIIAGHSLGLHVGERERSNAF